jgi:hypothetical protein
LLKEKLMEEVAALVFKLCPENDGWRFLRHVINYTIAGDSSGALLITRWLEIPPVLY